MGQILATFRRSQAKLEPYVGFAVSALVFFIAMAFMCLWHTYNTMTATTHDELLWYIATYQAPLRDVQIHGLALFMILGVSMRMLPALYGVAATPPRRAWAALIILILAVVGECGIFIWYRFTESHAIAALLLVPWLMLLGGVGMIVGPWKLWKPFNPTDRSAKFIRAAYTWLVISLLMLLALPVYQIMADTPFSHAYYGAIRHAITVGFISLMIMGFAAKVVPTLNGLDVRQLSSLWGPFILINTGCFLRVSLQTLTDFHPIFFALVGISGTLEVIALAWWGLGLIKLMRQGKRQEGETPSAKARPERIEAFHIVKDVYDWFPATHSVFDRYGFAMLHKAVLRRTVARTVTIEQVARMHQVPLEQFLQDLNRAQRLTVLT